MKKTVVYIAMSLDGYIADLESSAQWLAGDNSDPDAPTDYGAFVAAVDIVVLGHRTFLKIVTEYSPAKWPFAGKTTYVLTRQDHRDVEDIHFVWEPADRLLSRLQNEGEGIIWLAGGADLINQALEAKMVDEINIAVVPILLGNGIRLFDRIDVTQELTLLSENSHNGIVDLHYRVGR